MRRLGGPISLGVGDSPRDRLDLPERGDRGCVRRRVFVAVKQMVPSDVPIFFGEGTDALGRFVKAMEQYQAEGVVCVGGDNLFIDPGLIDRLVTTAGEDPDCDYVSYCSRDGRPAILSPASVYGEWFRAGALRKANRLARSQLDREHVTRYMYSHPEKFNLRLLPAPPEIDRDDVRLRSSWKRTGNTL